MYALETSWRRLLAGSAGPLTRWTLSPLCAALSRPYDWGQRFRLHAYARGWATVHRLPCRVISVGNLTLGGTGKTPLVEAIARLLLGHGHRVGVLSRGYGRRSAQSLVVVSDGRGCLASVDVAGDEPVLLAEHLPEVPVVVGSDRYTAGQLAIQRFGLDTVILDDGFQHVQLARDLDILVLDAAQPFGSGRLFPRGDLRERPAAMARADAIVLTRWTPEVTFPLPLTSHLAPPLFCSQHEPLALRALRAGPRLPLAVLTGQRLLAFCGIGAPESFRHLLADLGVNVVAFSSFADHHAYTQSEMEALARLAKAQGASALITTEKDAIRLRRLQPLPCEVWELQIRATIVDPQAAGWESCILGVA